MSGLRWCVLVLSLLVVFSEAVVFNKERLRSSSSSSSSSSNAEKDAKQFQNIAKEILTSEKTYLERLRKLSDVYFVAYKGKIPDADYTTLVGNVPDLITLSQEIVKNLTASPNDPGTVLTNASPRLSTVFSEYARSQPLRTDISTSRAVTSIVIAPSANLQTLDAYLILPIQRLPRYELFVKELMKYSPQDDAAKLQPALDGVKKAAKDMDAATAIGVETAGTARAAALFSKITELPAGFVKDGRFLTASVKMTKARQHIGEKSVNVYLFRDNTLLWTNQDPDKYKGHFSLADATFKSTGTLQTELTYTYTIPRTGASCQIGVKGAKKKTCDIIFVCQGSGVCNDWNNKMEERFAADGTFKLKK